MTDEPQPHHRRANADDQSFWLVCDSITRKYGQLMDSMPDGIIITDTSGRIVLANAQAESLFDYERGELISLEIETLVPKPLRADHVGLRDSFYANPSARSLGLGQEFFGVGRDGVEIPVEINLSPMPTEHGMLICASVRNATARKQAEDALHASEEQVRSLLDSTLEAIYGLDLQGNCTFCNRACLETLGYDSTEDLLGQNMHDLIHHTRPDGSEYPMHECKIFQAFRVGEGSHVDDEVLWKSDGSSFPAEYRSFPVHRNGELTGSVVTFLDITEKKRIDEALRTQQAELTHAARLSTLGEMAAGLAHELNQPLTAMSAFAEGAIMRINRGKLQGTEATTVFKRIAEDAQRAGEIIRRLRNFVQKREAQRIPIDLNHLVSDVYKFAESDASHKDMTIQFNLADSLPIVIADPIEIQQVLMNLIRNASDAIEKSEVSKRNILISSRENIPGRVEIIVDDSGPGIPDDMADQVFEPFYTSKADGLGIGLGICQSIIEAHAGKMWLGHSSMGGASFHFDLPSRGTES